MTLWIVIGCVGLGACAMAMFTALVAALVETAVPPVGKEIAIDGTKIRYVDVGSGPPVVLIHGLAGTLRHFTYALVERLQADHRVIALDRPGCGHSRTAPNAGLQAQAGVIAGFIRSARSRAPARRRPLARRRAGAAARDRSPRQGRRPRARRTPQPCTRGRAAAVPRARHLLAMEAPDDGMALGRARHPSSGAPRPSVSCSPPIPCPGTSA